MNTLNKKSIGLKFLAAFLFVFGLATLKSGGAILFFDKTAEVAAGDYVSFVLWSNFIAGFFYLIASVGIFFKTRWSVKLVAAISIFTVCLFIAFGFHILTCGLYEMRTVGAMIFRTSVWIIATLILLKIKH